MGHWNRVKRVSARTSSMLEGWTGEPTASSEVISVGGEELTPSKIVDRLTKHRHFHDRVEMSRLVLQYAILDRDQQLAAEQRFQENLAVIVRQMCGPDRTRMSKFGVAPVKRRGKLSVEDQVIAKAREHETRQERQIKGVRQREGIKAEQEPRVVVSGLPSATPNPKLSR